MTGMCTCSMDKTHNTMKPISNLGFISALKVMFGMEAGGSAILSYTTDVIQKNIEY